MGDKGEAFVQGSLFIKDGGILVKIRIRNVLWIQVEDKYCKLNTKKRAYTIRVSLKEIGQKLNEESFAQSHKGYLVNLKKIDWVDLQSNCIYVKGHEIPIGRSYKNLFIQSLDILR